MALIRASRGAARGGLSVLRRRRPAIAHGFRRTDDFDAASNGHGPIELYLAAGFVLFHYFGDGSVVHKPL